MAASIVVEVLGWKKSDSDYNPRIVEAKQLSKNHQRIKIYLRKTALCEK